MPRGRGRPARISRDDIVRAVVEVGFAKASLPAVAAHLGVGHSTLYGHFESRDAMASSAAESVLSRRSWPTPTADWRAYLSGVAEALFQACIEHPGLARELVGLPQVPPTVTTAMSNMATTLIDAGMSPSVAIVASNAVFHVSTDLFAERAADSDRRQAQIRAAFGDDDAPLRAAFAEAAGQPVDDWFHRTLALLLDGIGVSLNAHARAPNESS